MAPEPPPLAGMHLCSFRVLYLKVSFSPTLASRNWHYCCQHSFFCLTRQTCFTGLLSGSETWAELEPHMPPVPGGEACLQDSSEFQILWS